MKNHLALLVALFLIACPGDTTPVAVDAGAKPAPTDAPPPPLPLDNAPAQPTPDWMLKPRPPLGNVRAAGTRPPIIPASWTVPAWFIDPANSSGAASDNNTCTTSGAPCLTYAEIAARWGTYFPRLRQTTTFTWMSSHTDGTDPVIQNPYLENGASLFNNGTLVQTCTGTLAGVVAKNRNTPQLLNATLPAGAAINQLIINTTHASRAWTYTSLGAGAFSISQPLVSQTLPHNFILAGSEVDTWANTDAVTCNTLSNINFVQLYPTVTDLGTGSANAGIYLQQIGVFAPFSTSDLVLINSQVRFFEVFSNKGIQTVLSTSNATNGVYNTDVLGNFQKQTCAQGSTAFVGGIARGPQLSGCTVIIDGDAIAAATNNIIQGLSSTVAGVTGLGLVYIESGKSLQASAGATGIANNLSIGTPILWGPGNFRLVQTAHVTYPTGAGSTTFIQTGAFTINGFTTACGHSNANNPDVINCAINITGANLDAAQGIAGFGGNAFIPGGGGISTF